MLQKNAILPHTKTTIAHENTHTLYEQYNGQFPDFFEAHLNGLKNPGEISDPALTDKQKLGFCIGLYVNFLLALNKYIAYLCAAAYYRDASTPFDTSLGLPDILEGEQYANIAKLPEELAKSYKLNNTHDPGFFDATFVKNALEAIFRTEETLSFEEKDDKKTSLAQAAVALRNGVSKNDYTLDRKLLAYAEKLLSDYLAAAKELLHFEKIGLKGETEEKPSFDGTDLYPFTARFKASNQKEISLQLEPFVLYSETRGHCLAIRLDKDKICYKFSGEDERLDDIEITENKGEPVKWKGFLPKKTTKAHPFAGWNRENATAVIEKNAVAFMPVPFWGDGQQWLNRFLDSPAPAAWLAGEAGTGKTTLLLQALRICDRPTKESIAPVFLPLQALGGKTLLEAFWKAITEAFDTAKLENCPTNWPGIFSFLKKEKHKHSLVLLIDGLDGEGRSGQFNELAQALHENRIADNAVKGTKLHFKILGAAHPRNVESALKKTTDDCGTEVLPELFYAPDGQNHAWQIPNEMPAPQAAVYLTARLALSAGISEEEAESRIQAAGGAAMPMLRGYFFADLYAGLLAEGLADDGTFETPSPENLLPLAHRSLFEKNDAVWVESLGERAGKVALLVAGKLHEGPKTLAEIPKADIVSHLSDDLKNDFTHNKSAKVDDTKPSKPESSTNLEAVLDFLTEKGIFNHSGGTTAGAYRFRHAQWEAFFLARFWQKDIEANKLNPEREIVQLRYLFEQKMEPQPEGEQGLQWKNAAAPAVPYTAYNEALRYLAQSYWERGLVYTICAAAPADPQSPAAPRHCMIMAQTALGGLQRELRARFTAADLDDNAHGKPLLWPEQYAWETRLAPGIDKLLYAVAPAPEAVGQPQTPEANILEEYAKKALLHADFARSARWLPFQLMETARLIPQHILYLATPTQYNAANSLRIMLWEAAMEMARANGLVYKGLGDKYFPVGRRLGESGEEGKSGFAWLMYHFANAMESIKGWMQKEAKALYEKSYKITEGFVEKGYGGDAQRSYHAATCTALASLLQTTDLTRAHDLYKKSYWMTKDLVKKGYQGDTLRQQMQ